MRASSQGTVSHTVRGRDCDCRRTHLYENSEFTCIFFLISWEDTVQFQRVPGFTLRIPTSCYHHPSTACTQDVSVRCGIESLIVDLLFCTFAYFLLYSTKIMPSGTSKMMWPCCRGHRLVGAPGCQLASRPHWRHVRCIRESRSTGLTVAEVSQKTGYMCRSSKYQVQGKKMPRMIWFDRKLGVIGE